MRVRLIGRIAVYVDSSHACIPYVDPLREAQLLLETPLKALHQVLGAKLVPFAG